MTQRRRDGNAVLRVLGAALLVLCAVLPSCESTTKEGSESHFQKCTSDSECHGKDDVCSAGRCVPVPGADASLAPDGSKRLPPPDVHPDSGVPGGFVCNQGAPDEHAGSLDHVCATLVRLGITACPASRSEFLANTPTECAPGGLFLSPGVASLNRGCGFDTVMQFLSNNRVVFFRFDAGTGALVGAAFSSAADPSLPCGVGRYFGGNGASGTCADNHACTLCVTGDCPTDIETEAVASPCPAADAALPSDAGVCQCAGSLPRTGDVCEGRCAHCGGGTCWSDCHCLRDGTRRYLKQCTE